MIIGEGQGFEIDNQDDSASDTGAAFQQDDTEFNIFNTDRQLSALETAVKMLGSLNEKKALVYFASGMQRNGLDNQAQFQATINAAIRANVSFYPIDARGLVAQAPLGDATKGSPGGQAMYSGSSARAATSNFQNQQETLYTLAADTGGKALLDNNDLSMGIVQAQKDITSYYIIGYYSTNDALDGHFRRIKITVNTARWRAHRQARLPPGILRRQAVQQIQRDRQGTAARRSPDAGRSGHGYGSSPWRSIISAWRATATSFRWRSRFPAAKSNWRGMAAPNSTRIDFIGEIKDAKGATVANVRDNIRGQAERRNRQQLAKTTLEYDTGFTLPPGAYTAKFLARENETGKMGTFESKFRGAGSHRRAETTFPSARWCSATSAKGWTPPWPPPRKTRRFWPRTRSFRTA